MNIKRNESIKHRLPHGKTKDNYPYSLSDKIFHTKQLFFYSEKVEPGKLASAPHSHSTNDEIIFITKGELYAYQGDQKALLKEGDSIYFHAHTDEKHYLENKSQSDAFFLIFRNSGTSDSDVNY